MFLWSIFTLLLLVGVTSLMGGVLMDDGYSTDDTSTGFVFLGIVLITAAVTMPMTFSAMM